MTNLLKIKKNQTAKILSLGECMDLQAFALGVGLLPGDEVKVVGESFLGSPVSIIYGDSDLLALRKEQAAAIKVEVL